jgi:GntR family transcriptional regulator
MGAPIPAEQRLAAEYGISRGTVRNALAALERRGMLEPARGNGWIVSSTLQAREFAEMRTYPEWAESHGLKPGGRVVAQRADTPIPAEVRAFRIGLNERVLRVTRLRTLDGRAIMLERTAYAPWVALVIEALPADEPSVAAALARVGIRSAHGTHRVDAIRASAEDATLLSVARSSPLLRVRREYSDASGRVIEMGDDRYLPGSVSFVIDASAQ